MNDVEIKNNLESPENGEDVHFEKLTPNGEIDILSYESALDFALIKAENNDITNIAMTGLYGAGKSSILKAYEDNKSGELTFLNISLAHYNGADDMKTKNLEGKIVNQLLHQIDYKKIPQTIFKVKDNTSQKVSWLYSLCIVLMIGLVYGWVNFRSLTKFVQKVMKNTIFDAFIGSNWFGVLWFILMGALTSFIFYRIIKIQIDKRPLKSLKIGGNQIEILEQSKESYFDKFMNDVIYLFVNSDADVIVFEDLDRFEDQTIYEKLREINILANKRRRTFKKGIFQRKPVNKKLSFLYLIKDDMFKSKDRTKFFDFIIPIVPVMDSSNSYQKFLEVFDNLQVQDDFDKKLLRKLALYIDDYRLLKNVANEYYLYKNRIESSGIILNKDKLLALIIYKNIFPSDFSALQYGKSYLNAIFVKKDELVQEETWEIKKELEEVQENIEAAQEESLINIDELDAIYFKNSPDYSIIVDKKYERDFETRTDFIRAIKNSDFKIIKRTLHGYSYTDTNYDMSPDFDLLNDSDRYSTRRKNIENKTSEKNKELLLKKKRLNSRLNKIRATSIKNLLVDKDIDFFKDIVAESPKEFDKKTKKEKSIFEYLLDSDYFDLLLLLVRDELIDEKYSDYMTYFYEGKLSRNDKDFVRRILDNKRVDESYVPENCEEVLSNIPVEEFMRYRVKNISLTSWVLYNREKYKEYWNALLSDIKEANNIKFVYQVYQSTKSKGGHFFDILNEDWSEIVIGIINSEELDEYEKLQFIADYIIYTDYETIKSLKKLEQLTFYIGESKLLSSDIISEEHMMKRIPDLKKLGVEFIDISSNLISEEIVRKITELQIFTINKGNIKAILQAFNKKVSIEAFDNYNYKAIVSLNEATINIALFGDRFNQYFVSYLGFGNNILSDDPDNVVNMLNSENIEQEIKIRYIERVKPYPKIRTISEIADKGLWWKSATMRIVASTTENVISMLEYNEWELREELVMFINSASEPLKFNPTKLGSDKSSAVFKAFIDDEKEIHDKQYLSILKSLNRSYQEGVPEKIPESRMDILVENNIIVFTAKNLVSIRATRKKSLVQFLSTNFNDYMETIEDDAYFDNDELVKMLQSGKFSIPQSKKMIDKMQYPLSIMNYEYKDAIKRYILKNKFDIEDIGYLTEKYNEFSESVREETYYRISEPTILAKIIDDNLSMNKTLLNKLLSDNEIQIYYKQHIFSKNLSKFSELEVVDKIQDLSLPEDFINVLQRRKGRVENTELNLEIARQYKKKNWITKLEDTGDELLLQGRRILVSDESPVIEKN